MPFEVSKLWASSDANFLTRECFKISISNIRYQGFHIIHFTNKQTCTKASQWYNSWIDWLCRCGSEMSVGNYARLMSSVHLDIKYCVQSNQLVAIRYHASDKRSLVFEHVILRKLLMFQFICIYLVMVVSLYIKSFSILVIFRNFVFILACWWEFKWM